jgi:transposase
MRPKGTKQQLEIRRRVAVALLDAGWGIRQVARQVKASPGSVCRGRDRLAQDGEAGLTAKPHPGSQAKLRPPQCQALLDLLSQGARAHGYGNELGTLRRIAALIARHFGLTYCPSGVWRVVRRLKWSPQKPARRARERDEGAIARWRSPTGSRLTKSPA